jgi:hypothetical protein
MSIKGFGRECVNYFKGKKFCLCQQKQREWANLNVNKGLGKDFHPRDMWKCQKKRCTSKKFTIVCNYENIWNLKISEHWKPISHKNSLPTISNKSKSHCTQNPKHVAHKNSLFEWIRTIL